jgi:hypothetical protein
VGIDENEVKLEDHEDGLPDGFELGKCKNSLHYGLLNNIRDDMTENYFKRRVEVFLK